MNMIRSFRINTVLLILVCCIVGVAAIFGKSPQKQSSPHSGDSIQSVPEIRRAIEARSANKSEQRAVRHAYLKLMRYHAAGLEELAATSQTKPRMADHVSFELSDFRTGAIGEVADRSLADFVSHRNGNVLNVTAQRLQHESGPVHSYYDVEWNSNETTGNSRALTSRGTVAGMIKSKRETLKGTDRYTSYQVTVRLGEKQRTYRALALHRTAQTGQIETTILDSVTQNIDAVLADRSPRVRAPWALYVQSSLYNAVVASLDEVGEQSPEASENKPLGFIAGDDAKKGSDDFASSAVIPTCQLSKPTINLKLDLNVEEKEISRNGQFSPSVRLEVSGDDKGVPRIVEVRVKLKKKSGNVDFTGLSDFKEVVKMSFPVAGSESFGTLKPAAGSLGDVDPVIWTVESVGLFDAFGSGIDNENERRAIIKATEEDLLVVGQPYVNRFDVRRQRRGKQITILDGEHFGKKKGDGSVKFSNGGVVETAGITNWGNQMITFTVPTHAEPGDNAVVVENRFGEHTSPGEDKIHVIGPPTIVKLSRDTGKPTDSVTIEGKYFGEGTNSRVTFGNFTFTKHTAQWSDEAISFVVPANASPGNYTVQVVLPEDVDPVSNTKSFTVLSRLFFILDPAFAKVGDTVTLRGEGFGTTQPPGSKVTFTPSLDAQPLDWKDGAIPVKVPTGAKSGLVTLTIGTESASADFMLATSSQSEPPQIGSISPNSAVVGARVTITGSSFGPTQAAGSVVKFSGTPATIESWSDNQIVAFVPAGATSGTVAVEVGGVRSNEVAFTVSAPPPPPPPAGGPMVNSLSPASGRVGTQILIVGGGFGATKGSSTVTFNGVQATVVSWTNLRITVKVPAGATTGNVVVTVNGVQSNGLRFTVLP